MIKKVIMITLTAFVIISAGSVISISVKFHDIKENVKEINPEITRIESIHSIGSWGEGTSEYSLVVFIDNKKYRVWTNGNGELNGKVLLE